jgi:hypothetical protein
MTSLLLNQIAGPAAALRPLIDRGMAEALLAADLDNGELAGAVFPLDRFPIHTLAFGHLVGPR